MTKRPFSLSVAKRLALCAGLGLAALAVTGCSSREERAQAYYEKGKAYLDQKDYVKARVELRNALQRKDNLLPAWKALAEIDEHDQNVQGLAGDLRRINEIDPKDVPSATKLARIYLLGGAYDQALKLANAASEIEPKNAEILALKAAVLFKLRDVDGATKAAQEALAIDPANTAGNVVLAGIHFSQGNGKQALDDLSHVAKDHNDDLGVIFLKLNIFSQGGNVAEVEGLLRKLITLHPEIPAFRTRLVQFYVQQKRPDDAVNELRSVVKANPADVPTELQLVSLLGSVKGPAAAREELLARINAGGAVFPYQIALAKFDYAQGKTDDSIKALQQLASSVKSQDDSIVAKTTLAEIYFSRNDIAATEPLIDEILKADSHNTVGLRLRASIRLNRGQVDDAIGDLRSALNYQPRSPELLASLAIAYERGGQVELADKAFFDAMKASNYNPVIGLNYVGFLRRRGNGAQAESVLSDLASRNPSNVAVLSALAQVKLAHQDWVGAHTLADTIKRLQANNTVADEIDAAAFSGQGKFNDSLAILQNAYNANPGALRPMVDLVAGYLRSGQTAQAESFVRSVLRDNPANAEALVLMGSIQLVKNAPAEAETNFKSAIEKKPSDPAGYRALADLYTRQRKIDDALAIVRNGLKEQPQNFGLQLTQAGLMEIKGDFEGAIAQYDAMLKDQPGSLVVINNLASLLADHRTDKASLDRANTLAAALKNSQIPQFMDTSGWISYQREDYRTALPLLESAAKSLPNAALVQYHLGMAYLSTGQDDKAREQFKKAQTLAPSDSELKAKIESALKKRPSKQPS